MYTVFPAKVDVGNFKLDLVRGNMPQSEVSQAVLNGKRFLQDRRTLILGISPGNPYYYSLDVLERLFGFARQNSDKVGKRLSLFFNFPKLKCLFSWIGVCC